MPEKSEIDKIIQNTNKKHYKKIYKSQTMQERESRFSKFKKEMTEILGDKEYQDEILTKDRDMTAAVASRWYRSPEIVLT